MLYTDILSGPISGGENDKGIYLSIFGKNFGTTGLGTTVRVYLGDVEVDNYRYLGPSRGRPDIQQITVQVGAVGNPPAGATLPIKVVVDDVVSNTDRTFTVQPGDIFFVDNVSGNDSTAVAGDISHPYRFVQTAALYTGGAWPNVGPGDFIVMRGRGTAWTDVGFENYFLRYRDKSGSAPTGAVGSGPITVMGYPTEDVYILGLRANGITGGCITAVNGQAYPTAGKWATVTNLRIDCEGYDGPVSQQIYGDHWRVVNNDLSASTAPRSGSGVPRMAGIVSNGQDSVLLGNHIHDIQGSAQECHGIYIDGDGSFEIAYNNIHDIRDGNGFQIYVNGGNGATVADDVNFHHNIVHDVSKHGINIADGSRNNISLHNNVVYNTNVAGIRFNTTTLAGARIFNNTFYNTVTGGNTSHGAIMNDWNLSGGAMELRNNIFWPHSGTRYSGGSNGMSGGEGTIANNLWYGGAGGYSFDSAPVTGNPNFVSPGADFHLGPGPAVDAGSASVSGLVTNDYDVTTLRPANDLFDIGAYEYTP